MEGAGTAVGVGEDLHGADSVHRIADASLEEIAEGMYEEGCVVDSGDVAAVAEGRTVGAAGTAEERLAGMVQGAPLREHPVQA